MKSKMIIGALVVFVLNLSAYATLYEIGAGDNFGSKSLSYGDELLMTGGWGNNISMSGDSVANIHATDPGKQIWNINAGGISTLNIYGGTVNTVELTNGNFTTIRGGNIGTLISVQENGDPGGIGLIPSTYLYVSEWSYNSDSMVLTGKWQDLTSFSIQLEDKYNRVTFDNLVFIPEPISLLLLGLGGLFLRKK